MTLEPVHMKAISSMASSIDTSITEDEPDIATSLFSLLQELTYRGDTVLKSLEKLNRSKVSMDEMSLSRDNFSTTYSCDSGSTNPIAFDNGTFVDFCHCAVASTPTDPEIHRKRTIVAATYSPSMYSGIHAEHTWTYFDEGMGKKKIIKIQPGLLNKRTRRMVHDIALYYAESEHILWMIEEFDSNGFFIMDGPVYPKQLMYWMVVDSDDIQIRDDPNTKKILQNYVDIMDHHIENRIPLIGFVKNPEDMQIMRTIRREKKRSDVPWLLDAQFFKCVLSPPSHNKQNKAKLKRHITYTSWFLQPNQFYENMLKENSPLVDKSITHKFPCEYYALTFFMVYVPSMNTIFKIEAPYGLTKDEEMRDMIKTKVLHDLSVNKIPLTLSKADSIAKIRLAERKQIIRDFRSMRVDTEYNDIRWSETDEYR